MGIGLRGAAAVLAIACACASAAAWALPAANDASGSHRVTVIDDDGGQALFDVSGLVPGEKVERCLALDYAGDGPGEVRLTAVTDGGPQTDHLHLAVWAGRGGSFGDCKSFRGPAVFEGTLAGLAGQAGGWGAGVPVLRPAGSGRHSVRLVAWLGPGARQSATARADFAFEVRPTPVRAAPVPPPSDTPPGSVGTAPGPAASRTPGVTRDAPVGQGPAEGGDDPTAATQGAGVSPGTVGRAGASRRTTRGGGDGREAGADRRDGSGRGRADAAPPPTASRPGRRDDGRAKRADGAGGWLGERLGQVGEAATAVLVRSPFPVLLLFLVLAYLAVQNRIDRRDPKLALASVFPEPDLHFSNQSSR